MQYENIIFLLEYTKMRSNVITCASSSALLSQLKISCLETQKKEAKHKYHEYTQSYVIASLGRPLEKLHVCGFVCRLASL